MSGMGWTAGWSAALLALALLSAAAPAVPDSTPHRSVVVSEAELSTRRGPTHVRIATPAGGSAVAVVLVAGAGATDRSTLATLADGLAEQGITAVSYDKHLADYSARRRNYPALAGDARDIVTAVREATGAPRVGILGFSEGSWVAPLATADDPTIDFLVLASAPVVTPGEQAAWVVDQRLARTPTALRRAAASAMAGGRGWLDYFDADTRSALAGTRVPILAVWGADDTTVPVVTAARRLTAAAGSAVTQVVLAGAGHDLATARWPGVAASWIQLLP